MMSRKVRFTSRDTVMHILSNTSSSSATISWAGSEAGDVAIVVVNKLPAPSTPAGWTLLESATLGGMYVKALATLETSVTFSGTCDQICVSIFRNCLTPTSANSAANYSIADVDPNPPAAPISAVVQDMVVVATAVTIGTQSYNSLMPTGFEGFAGALSSSHMTLIGGATGLTGAYDPGVFDLNLGGSYASVAYTLVLERS